MAATWPAVDNPETPGTLIGSVKIDSDGSQAAIVPARRAVTWDTHGTLGLVVGATYPADVAAVRQIAPRAPILLPGVGAQAGDLEHSVRSGVDADGGGVLVNASRSILYASSGSDWQTAARAEATRLRAAINTARAPSATAPH